MLLSRLYYVISSHFATVVAVPDRDDEMIISAKVKSEKTSIEKFIIEIIKAIS